jgi:hypothetical protein
MRAIGSVRNIVAKTWECAERVLLAVVLGKERLVLLDAGRRERVIWMVLNCEGRTVSKICGLGVVIWCVKAVALHERRSG